MRVCACAVVFSLEFAIALAPAALAYESDLPNANLPGNSATLPNSNLPGSMPTDNPISLPSTDTSSAVTEPGQDLLFPPGSNVPLHNPTLPPTEEQLEASRAWQNRGGIADLKAAQDQAANAQTEAAEARNEALNAQNEAAAAREDAANARAEVAIAHAQAAQALAQSNAVRQEMAAFAARARETLPADSTSESAPAAHSESAPAKAHSESAPAAPSESAPAATSPAP